MIISEKQIWDLMDALRTLLDDDLTEYGRTEARKLLYKIIKQQSKELKVIE